MIHNIQAQSALANLKEKETLLDQPKHGDRRSPIAQVMCKQPLKTSHFAQT